MRVNGVFVRFARHGTDDRQGSEETTGDNKNDKTEKRSWFASVCAYSTFS